LNEIDSKEELVKGIYTGLIDGTSVSLETFQPKLLVNNTDSGTKVLTSIISELKKCDEFFFSVAFVTNSGVSTLVNTLIELQSKGVRGKIIASQYQNFTEPRALDRLIELGNIDVRIITEGNFHAKGYVFRKGDTYSLIVGSSNLTGTALCINKEWNVKVISTKEGSLIQKTMEDFDNLYSCSTMVDAEWVIQYKKIYDAQQAENKSSQKQNLASHLDTIHRVSPNKMQVEALKALEGLRCDSKNKALIISATGTGKTYLSAFDVKKYDPKRFLFVVHRENIARAAKRTFEMVFGKEKSMGLLCGRSKNLSGDYLFSTIQTLSKNEILSSFPRDHFDYIVIDEVHRSGAETYQKIINYFTPEFILGMSATPERTDGYDIFNAFDYNIAFEIRLHNALKEDMLVPFHYYGISDISVDGVLLDDHAGFNKLTCSERVEKIIFNARLFGCDHGRIKGLVFCSRIEEATRLSDEFNKRGWETVALSGDSSEEQREQCIDRLEMNDGEEALDYIFTVDIFNEGVDIPSVNQIIMLRPTQSAIVFVQQLGRGLRKSRHKEYLTVIDFIGNYSNNYLVPIALYGDNSYNKDTIRRLVSSGSSFIPGASTVNFDRVTQERIYDAIDFANVNSSADLKKDYMLLKYKLGHVPKMMDFIGHGSRDPFTYVIRHGSFYNYVAKQEKLSVDLLDPLQINTLNFFSKEVLNGKRIEEVLIIKALMEADSIPINSLHIIMAGNYTVIDFSRFKENIAAAVNYINGAFFKDSDRRKYNTQELIVQDNDCLTRTQAFKNLMEAPVLVAHLNDALEYALYKFNVQFDAGRYHRGFVLYQKYSRKDVCRILNWPRDESSVLYGYRIKHDSCPIFVTYSKDADISKSTNYEDYFINSRKFHWMTRNRIRMESSEVQDIKDHKNKGLRILLFIKKSDAESSEFYYMGDIEPVDFNEMTIKNDKGDELPIVNINFIMKCPVDDNIYNYLHHNSNMD